MLQHGLWAYKTKQGTVERNTEYKLYKTDQDTEEYNTEYNCIKQNNIQSRVHQIIQV